MRQSLDTLAPAASPPAHSAASAGAPAPWPARVAALMGQLDALIDERVAEPAADPADVPATMRALARLEHARAELGRLIASDRALRAEQHAALALIEREAPSLYAALAAAAIHLTTTMAPECSLGRPPGWGLSTRQARRARRR